MNNVNTNNLVAEIIKNLEEGVNPWRKAWVEDGFLPLNIASGKNYNGGNIFLLQFAKYFLKFAHSFWGTFAQYNNAGFHVKMGCKSIPLCHYSINVKKIFLSESTDTSFWNSKEISDGYKHVRKYILNYFNVFNIEQTTMKIEDIEKYSKIKLKAFNNPLNINAEKIVENFAGPEIVRDNINPCYCDKKDKIFLPDVKFFKSSEGYYSTLFHEMIHSTGYQNRLNRSCLKDYSKDRKMRAKEELIAEIGAAALCSLVGIKNKTIQNSTSYIKSWLKSFNDDPAYLFTICSAAQKAVDMIIGNNTFQG